MGSIIIKDDATGQSYSFGTNREDYFAADAKIRQITGSGHRVSGDITKVASYVGGATSYFGSHYSNDDDSGSSGGGLFSNLFF